MLQPPSNQRATRRNRLNAMHDPEDRSAFSVLFARLASNSAEFWINKCLAMKVVDPNSFDSKGHFRRKVELVTDENFNLRPKQDTDEPCDMSESPFCMPGIVHLQSLNAIFGRPDHKKRKLASCNIHRKSKRPKITHI